MLILHKSLFLNFLLKLLELSFDNCKQLVVSNFRDDPYLYIVTLLHKTFPPRAGPSDLLLTEVMDDWRLGHLRLTSNLLMLSLSYPFALKQSVPML